MIPVMYSHFQINSLCCMYTCSSIHSLVPPNFYSSPLNKNVCYKPNKNSIFRYSHCCCTIFILTPYPLYIHFHQCLVFTECCFCQKFMPQQNFPFPLLGRGIYFPHPLRLFGKHCPNSEKHEVSENELKVKFAIFHKYIWFLLGCCYG